MRREVGRATRATNGVVSEACELKVDRWRANAFAG